MIVLSEAAEQRMPSASARDIAASTEAARLAGGRVYTIPPDFERCGTAENALCHIPPQNRPTPAVWVGYIPSPERYAAIYEAAGAKKLRLVNSLEEHLDAQEIDRAYARLGDLTPQTAVVAAAAAGADALSGAVARVGGFPVFVKGAVQSRKARGWKACVAQDLSELERLSEAFAALPERTRGRVVVRRLVPLRHVRRTPAGDFPLGREFRAFLLNGEVVGLGYYWEGEDPLAALAPEEDDAVRALAREAARRVGTPYVTVDVAQAETGRWLVLETGDAQFSGVSRVPPLELWHALRERLTA